MLQQMYVLLETMCTGDGLGGISVSWSWWLIGGCIICLCLLKHSITKSTARFIQRTLRDNGLSVIEIEPQLGISNGGPFGIIPKSADLYKVTYQDSGQRKVCWVLEHSLGWEWRNSDGTAFCPETSSLLRAINETDKG